MSFDIHSLVHEADQLWSNALVENPHLKDKIYSDFRDKNNRQIIDLVQEGGGMLGIGLVGYTYILEKAGLRISSYAGASAGAINATYLASIPDTIYDKEHGYKSLETLKILADTDMSAFLDGNRIVKFILRNSLNDYGVSKRFYLFVLSFIGLFLGFNLTFFYLTTQINTWLDISYPRVITWIMGTLGAMVTVFLFYKTLRWILGDKIGLNRGDTFFNWLKTYLNLNSEKIILENIDGFHLGQPSLIQSRRIVLITASLSNKKLVKLPEDAHNYFANQETTHPAEYVRASMSIPFFFDIYSPLKPKDPETPEQFVDGGLLSNFPIRELNNKSLTCPRFPTFGVKLGREDLDTEEKKKSKPLLFHYIGSLLSTLRSFYDTEFQKDNSEVSMLIGYVDTRDPNQNNKEINWLNFDMSDRAKKVLFLNGVRDAIQFLVKFDWEAYKALRCK
ncbi:MAG: patatin-like phospholipase family protein [Chitinophagales bacterium]|nr:patatin-like phospholipase family protein [Chitinophagales bacterium]